MADETTPMTATAEASLASLPPGLIASSPIVESHRQLSKEWARLTRVATLVAVCTSPGVFVWYHHHNGWSVGISILATFFTIVAFRGLVDIIVRRLIPWPSLFGTDDARLREDDIVNRRRAWTWRSFARLARNLAIIITVIWLVRPGGDHTLGGWIHTPGWLEHKAGHLFSSGTFWIQVAFGFGLFFINIIIFLGPLLAMGISQIRGFEPGDAEWGVNLEHVRGQAEAKEDVRRVVTLWQSGEVFESAGGKRERGLLFLGPPGTGKTMLAKAIATGFNSPFVTIPGSGFAQTFIGVDAIIVRFLARKAKKLAKKWGGQCIVFIDEIDAVGMRRRALGTSSMVEPSADRLFYGPNGALNPSGDLVVESREWRDWMFERRAPEVTSPYPAWARKVSGIVNQGMMGGMMGMQGGMALNQLLVVMDGIDNPPMGRRVLTNKVNSTLDAVYVVPRRLGRTGGRIFGAGVALLGSLLFLNDLAALTSSPIVNAGTSPSTGWGLVLIAIAIAIIYAGSEAWRKASKNGTLSMRLPKAKASGSQIYFIGATNVPLDALDPALIRPGRMGRHVHFRTPTKDDRKDIFDLYLDKVAHEPDLDSRERRDEIARITNGYSPAMIDQICSMALTTAHHEGRARFGWNDLVEAMTVVESGTAVGVHYTDGEAKATAIHEAGHAVAAHVYRPGVESSRLSIRMRGRSLGHHQSFEKEERFGHFQSELFGSLVHVVGAMAAEHVFYGENTNGVGGDLFMATSEAATMVGQWGMAPEQLKFADSGEPLPVRDPAGLERRSRHGEFGSDEGPLDDETAEQWRERKVQRRFENIGLRLMNRTRGGAAQGDPIASALGDPMKRKLAAQLLGQAFVIAYNLMLINKEAVNRIADEVVEKKEIYGDDLIRLLDSQRLRRPELDWSNEAIWPKV